MWLDKSKLDGVKYTFGILGIVLIIWLVIYVVFYVILGIAYG